MRPRPFSIPLVVFAREAAAARRAFYTVRFLESAAGASFPLPPILGAAIAPIGRLLSAAIAPKTILALLLGDKVAFLGGVFLEGRGSIVVEARDAGLSSARFSARAFAQFAPSVSPQKLAPRILTPIAPFKWARAWRPFGPAAIAAAMLALAASQRPTRPVVVQIGVAPAILTIFVAFNVFSFYVGGLSARAPTPIVLKAAEPLGRRAPRIIASFSSAGLVAGRFGAPRLLAPARAPIRAWRFSLAAAGFLARTLLRRPRTASIASFAVARLASAARLGAIAVYRFAIAVRRAKAAPARQRSAPVSMAISRTPLI